MLKKFLLFLLFLIAAFEQVQASTSRSQPNKTKVVPIEIKVVPKKHSDSESSEETRDTERIYTEDENSSRSRKIVPESLIEYYEKNKQINTNIASIPKISITKETREIINEMEESDEIKELIKNANLSSLQYLRSSIMNNEDAGHIDNLHETGETRVKKRLKKCINGCLENGAELFTDQNDFNELKPLCKNSCKRKEAKTLKEIKAKVGEACIAHKLNQATKKNYTAFGIITELLKSRNSKLTNN